MPPVPARRHEALPEGLPVLYPQVRDRAAGFPARPAWPEYAQEDDRVRHAASREAEDEALLPRARPAARQLHERGGAPARSNRREPASAAGAAPRQRDLSAEYGLFARRGAPDGGASAFPGERPAREHSLLYPAARRYDRGSRGQ